MKSLRVFQGKFPPQSPGAKILNCTIAVKSDRKSPELHVKCQECQAAQNTSRKLPLPPKRCCETVLPAGKICH